MKLHSYFRSGTSHRTRIALNLKGLAYEIAPVNLADGAQRSDEFRALNPQALVPALEVGGAVLTQSVAILEWLEEAYPAPPLLPNDPIARAHVRAIAAAVGSEIHPLGNLRVLNAIRALGADDEGVKAWALRWISDGFAAIEQLLQKGPGGPWCWGKAPGLADCYVVPQVYAATSRYGFDMAAYPRLAGVAAAAESHLAFIAAHPLNQPDAPN